MLGSSTGVLVGGTGVLVGGIGVLVGGTGVWKFDIQEVLVGVALTGTDVGVSTGSMELLNLDISSLAQDKKNRQMDNKIEQNITF